MNFKLLSLSLFSFATVSAFIPALTPQAKAVCVATDVGVQVAIRDRNKPPTQVNNVNQNIDPNCFGNTSTSTGTQTSVGGGNTTQIRNSDHNLGPGQNPTGVKTPNIKVPVNVQVDVPAFPTHPTQK